MRARGFCPIESRVIERSIDDGKCLVKLSSPLALAVDLMIAKLPQNLGHLAAGGGVAMMAATLAIEMSGSHAVPLEQAGFFR